MRPSWSRPVLLLGLLLGLALLPARAAGQVASDSARTAILDRLKRLSRPPGLDSLLLVDDSVLQAQQAAAAARGRRGSRSPGRSSRASLERLNPYPRADQLGALLGEAILLEDRRTIRARSGRRRAGDDRRP